MEDLIAIAKRNKKQMNRLFIGCMGLVELLMLILVIVITWKAFNGDDQNFIYKAVSINIILLWIGILVGYYSWVIYFFNINLGLTNEDWAEIRQKTQNGETVDYPTRNPHADQTLGLPEGTVRGTLALSLAVGAMAMLIASLGIEPTMSLNQLFIDTFDFFKTAFLMMIAFYFGNKSLEALNLNPIKGLQGQSQQQAPPTTELAPQPTLAPAVDPNAAGVRANLINANDDIAPVKTVTSTDFEKANSNG
ncbi:MAG: hypothetical protein U5K79_10085 [Cyclobacteriaceae bacterium]|nr:hypothetical protein [Cyclobacteriaceae bacterium]